MKNMIWIHKKTGNYYEVLAEGIDCTNNRDGTEVVIYRNVGENSPFYVREKAEFLEKFIPTTFDM
jgi:hypothetical protein